MAADRAFFPGALSAKVTFAKALGCGYFPVRNREDRKKSACTGAVTCRKRIFIRLQMAARAARYLEVPALL